MIVFRTFLLRAASHVAEPQELLNLGRELFPSLSDEKILAIAHGKLIPDELREGSAA